MNEFEFINTLRKQSQSRRQSARMIKGIGDDASVITEKSGRDLLITTDLIVEGVDFHPQATPARMLGHKSLAVSLSDIAAMGGRPLYSLLSIGMPAETWRSNFRDEFYEGYFALADNFGVTLAGGDLSRTETGIVIDSIVIGEVASAGAILRSSAQPGDQIYVTGNLGGAAAGLKLIENGARIDKRSEVGGQTLADHARGNNPALSEGVVSEPRVVAIGSSALEEPNARSDEKAIQAMLLRQLRPEPRVGWGIVLGEERLATAMIDISDGLSLDLNHLCAESGAGALIHSSMIPLDENVKRLCGRRALDPLELALHGGEDFELLFTVHPENVARLPKRVDEVTISRIGVITEKSGSVRIREQNHEWELKPQGFEHFKH